MGLKRTLAGYFSATGEQGSDINNPYASYLMKGESVQAFVTAFAAHKITFPSLLELEVTGVATPAYADGLGNLVIPTLDDILYSNVAAGITTGVVSGTYEVGEDANYATLAASGSLGASPVTLAVGSVGPFYIRYKLSSTSGLSSPYFEDPSSPLMDPVIVGGGEPHTGIVDSVIFDPVPNTGAPGLTLFDGYLGVDFAATPPYGWSSTKPGTATITLSEPRQLVSYRIWPRVNRDFPMAPTIWTMEGSNDNVSWTTVDTQDITSNPLVWGGPNTHGLLAVDYVQYSRDFWVTSPGSFTYYRMVVTNSVNAVFVVNELQLYFSP